jgi:uncharacterized protein YndB with AHSA1/START domain
MTKKNLDASIHIAAAPERVWSVLADLKRMPEWSPQCRRMQPLGRVRDGAYTLNWMSKTIVQHVLGGEDTFDDEMLGGMKTTLAKIKAAVEAR